jgi:hypothetical protein
MKGIIRLAAFVAATAAASAAGSQEDCSLKVIGTMPFTAFRAAEAAMPEVKRSGLQLRGDYEVSVMERKGEFVVVVGSPTDPNILGNPSPDPLGTLEVHLDKKTLRVVSSNFAR